MGPWSNLNAAESTALFSKQSSSVCTIMFAVCQLFFTTNSEV